VHSAEEQLVDENFGRCLEEIVTSIAGVGRGLAIKKRSLCAR
jgi:hypothetical protein